MTDRLRECQKMDFKVRITDFKICHTDFKIRNTDFKIRNTDFKICFLAFTQPICPFLFTGGGFPVYKNFIYRFYYDGFSRILGGQN